MGVLSMGLASVTAVGWASSTSRNLLLPPSISSGIVIDLFETVAVVAVVGDDIVMEADRLDDDDDDELEVVRDRPDDNRFKEDDFREKKYEDDDPRLLEAEGGDGVFGCGVGGVIISSPSKQAIRDFLSIKYICDRSIPAI